MHCSHIVYMPPLPQEMKRALFLYAKLNPGLCYIQVRWAAPSLVTSRCGKDRPLCLRMPVSTWSSGISR